MTGCFNWYKCSTCGARVLYTRDDIANTKKCFAEQLCKTCCNIKKNTKQVTLSDYDENINDSNSYHTDDFN